MYLALFITILCLNYGGWKTRQQQWPKILQNLSEEIREIIILVSHSVNIKYIFSHSYRISFYCRKPERGSLLHPLWPQQRTPSVLRGPGEARKETHQGDDQGTIDSLQSGICHRISITKHMLKSCFVFIRSPPYFDFMFSFFPTFLEGVFYFERRSEEKS